MGPSSSDVVLALTVLPTFPADARTAVVTVLASRFRDQLVSDLSNGTYQPVLDEGVKACVPALEWWKGKQLFNRKADVIVKRLRRLQLVQVR
jgi:hypothetical protein